MNFKLALSGASRLVVFSVLLIGGAVGGGVWFFHKRTEQQSSKVGITGLPDNGIQEHSGQNVTPEYGKHIQERDMKEAQNSLGKPIGGAFVANPQGIGGDSHDFSSDLCSPTDAGGIYVDSKGRLLEARRGGTGPLVDAHGNPILDKNGKQIVVPKGYYAIVGPDGKPVAGRDGKPIIVSDKYRAVLGPDGKPILGPDGKPILVPKGYRVALATDGKPLLDKDGKPILVPKGYRVVRGPDGKILYGKDGKPIFVPNGYHVLLGPDGKPVYGSDGKPILVKDGMKVLRNATGNPILGKDGKPVLVPVGTVNSKGGGLVSDILGQNNATVGLQYNQNQAMSEDERKAQAKLFAEKMKAMEIEMASINDAEFPKKVSIPPIFDYHPKKQEVKKAEKGNPSGDRKSASASHSKPAGVKIPDYILALLRPGRLYYGTLDGEVNSDVPGPVLATVRSGKLNGAKLLGKFSRSHDYVVIEFTSMTMPNGDVYPLDAFAVNSRNLQDGLSVDVDHHYLSRYGALLAGAFLFGFGQAEMYAGGTSSVTQFGTPIFIPNTNTLIAQSMMGLGTAGQQLSNLAQQGFNRQTTVRVPKNQAIGILIIHAGAPKKSGLPSSGQKKMGGAQAGPQQTQSQPMGYTPPGGQMPMNGSGMGMPMMPMMP